MNKTDEHIRYARQLSLEGWGKQGQARLARKSVFIVGLGGLGSPAATYLAAAGVGELILNDFDYVDLSNLPRQPLHHTRDVDRPKTLSALETLRNINPGIRYRTIEKRLSHEELVAELVNVDCVIDCSDNFGTRFTINEAAVQTRTPLVSAAAIRMEGQLIFLRNDLDHQPCYRCLYDESNESTEDCAGQGVMTPLVGIIGSTAALLALNYLVLGVNNASKLHCFDAQALSWRSIALPKDPACPVCSSRSD